MTLDAETLKQQIPYYLTAEPAQKALLDGLEALKQGATAGYFIQMLFDPHAKSMLQGDGWMGFQVFSFGSGRRSSVRGIVLSNSCDLSPENERALPAKITFTPIVKLSAIRARFEERDFDPVQVEGKLNAIRKQSVTDMFYLPTDGPLSEEYVALLSDLHSMPATAHKQDEKLFTLSMAGFYLFIFKLSVHFCRLHEKVVRTPPAATA